MYVHTCMNGSLREHASPCDSARAVLSVRVRFSTCIHNNEKRTNEPQLLLESPQLLVALRLVWGSESSAPVCPRESEGTRTPLASNKSCTPPIDNHISIQQPPRPPLCF